MSADHPEPTAPPEGRWEQPGRYGWPAPSTPAPPPAQPPYSYGPPQPWGYAPPPPYYGPPQRQPRTEGTAIAVLVLSIASFYVFGVGVVMAIVALALCPSAGRNIEASDGALTGEGLVTAARTIAWINIGFVALMAVVFAVIVVLSIAFDDSDELSMLLALGSPVI
ncbi:MAG: hypothetical protein M3404_05660 [Actinomycetota bacterium]|nr:hypothetical protein [Actinomycetota bacterium]